jgi:hypothetical protein
MFQDDIDDYVFLRDELLNREMNPWDKIQLVYLGYIGYQNFQLMSTSYQMIQKSTEEMNLYQQCLTYFLLFYALNNINITYRYFLLKTYQINPEVARRVYRKFNKYFDTYSNMTQNQEEDLQEDDLQEDDFQEENIEVEIQVD